MMIEIKKLTAQFASMSSLNHKLAEELKATQQYNMTLEKKQKGE